MLKSRKNDNEKKNKGKTKKKIVTEKLKIHDKGNYVRKNRRRFVRKTVRYLQKQKTRRG